MRGRFWDREAAAKLSAIALIALLAASASASPRIATELVLRFPAADVAALGQIEELKVTVSCSSISTLRNVPELYDVEMGYDIPSQHVLDAKPRLGAAAVLLSQWSDVIAIRAPAGRDSRSCFDVAVIVQGRKGVERRYTGRQLGVFR